MNYRTMKILCKNRSAVFSNSATGGGDASIDEGAENVNPNNHLSPIIGGSKTFNVFALIAVGLVIILLSILTVKQLKTLKDGI